MSARSHTGAKSPGLHAASAARRRLKPPHNNAPKQCHEGQQHPPAVPGACYGRPPPKKKRGRPGDRAMMLDYFVSTPLRLFRAHLRFAANRPCVPTPPRSSSPWVAPLFHSTFCILHSAFFRPCVPYFFSSFLAFSPFFFFSALGFSFISVSSRRASCEASPTRNLASLMTRV